MLYNMYNILLESNIDIFFLRNSQNHNLIIIIVPTYVYIGRIMVGFLYSIETFGLRGIVVDITRFSYAIKCI